MSSSLRTTGWRRIEADWGGGMSMSASCKPQVFVSACNGWPHSALRYHQLMPISCHFRDCQSTSDHEFFSCKKRYGKYWTLAYLYLYRVVVLLYVYIGSTWASTTWTSATVTTSAASRTRTAWPSAPTCRPTNCTVSRATCPRATSTCPAGGGTSLTTRRLRRCRRTPAASTGTGTTARVVRSAITRSSAPYRSTTSASPGSLYSRSADAVAICPEQNFSYRWLVAGPKGRQSEFDQISVRHRQGPL